jgi:hypothetical protein
MTVTTVSVVGNRLCKRVAFMWRSQEGEAGSKERQERSDNMGGKEMR